MVKNHPTVLKFSISDFGRLLFVATNVPTQKSGVTQNCSNITVLDNLEGWGATPNKLKKTNVKAQITPAVLALKLFSVSMCLFCKLPIHTKISLNPQPVLRRRNSTDSGTVFGKALAFHIL